MIVDTGDYVGVANDTEKEPVAIINPDNYENDGQHLPDLPLANDCEYLRVGRTHHDPPPNCWLWADFP